MNEGNGQRTIRARDTQWIGKFGIYFIALALLPVGMLVSPNFFSVTNILNILDAVSYLGILAAGMAMVTYCGQSVDLSTPSSVAMSGFVSILTLRWGVVPMLVCTLLSGALLGAINGIVIGNSASIPSYGRWP